MTKQGLVGAMVALLAAFVAQLAFFSLLRRKGSTVVGAYMFLVPLVAAASGIALGSVGHGPIDGHRRIQRGTARIGRRGHRLRRRRAAVGDVAPERLVQLALRAVRHERRAVVRGRLLRGELHQVVKFILEGGFSRMRQAELDRLKEETRRLRELELHLSRSRGNS